MLDHKDNYEIRYCEGRWQVFRKGGDIPCPRADYGSRVEAEIGLDKQLTYWNIELDRMKKQALAKLSDMEQRALGIADDS